MAGLVATVVAVILAAQSAFAGQLVEHFPGYDGKLPFKLETGYISVEDSEMFYYFIESQGDPAKDPLFLWLSGGPGCSSFFAIIYEIGPLEINITNYDGGPVTFNDYIDAWTKSASIIFLDSPVGTGFSYSTTQHGWATSDTKAANQAYIFFLKWLEENPKYLPLETYIGGDSYSGMIVPQVTKLVVLGLEAHAQPRVNLKGYLLGSPTTDEFLNYNSKFIFAHRMGLISDDIYETAKESCKGNYMVVEPNNTKCVLALARYNKCVNGLFTNCILEPKCTFTKPLDRRSLQGSSKEFILSPPRVEHMWCRNFNYVLAYNWANDPQVREAIHVRKDTVTEWMRCNSTIDYTQNLESVIHIHKYLITKRLNVLVQSGDRDMIVPFVATMDWIKSLNLTVDEKWRPWFVDGQVAGYTEKYCTDENGYRMVFATVKLCLIDGGPSQAKDNTHEGPRTRASTKKAKGLGGNGCHDTPGTGRQAFHDTPSTGHQECQDTPSSEHQGAMTRERARALPGAGHLGNTIANMVMEATWLAFMDHALAGHEPRVTLCSRGYVSLPP